MDAALIEVEAMRMPEHQRALLADRLSRASHPSLPRYVKNGSTKRTQEWRHIATGKFPPWMVRVPWQTSVPVSADDLSLPFTGTVRTGGGGSILR